MWVLYEVLGYVCDQCDWPCLALGCTEISQYIARTINMRAELEKLQSDLTSWALRVSCCVIGLSHRDRGYSWKTLWRVFLLGLWTNLTLLTVVCNFAFGGSRKISQALEGKGGSPVFWCYSQVRKLKFIFKNIIFSSSLIIFQHTHTKWQDWRNEVRCCVPLAILVKWIYDVKLE